MKAVPRLVIYLMWLARSVNTLGSERETCVREHQVKHSPALMLDVLPQMLEGHDGKQIQAAVGVV